MNRVKKLLVILAILLPVFVAVPVLAHEGEVLDEQTDGTSQTTEKPKTGNEGLSVKERVQKYQEAVKTKLAAAEKFRVVSRCKAAQGKVSSLSGRIQGIETSRDQKYHNLVDRLTSLSEKLKAKNIDTAAYDAQVAELETLITTFETDLAKYKEAVATLAEMDCTADPDGFKSALTTARTLRTQVVTDGAAIKTHLSTKLKPTIMQLRAQVAAETDSGENN